jgi:hypothetical protein
VLHVTNGDCAAEGLRKAGLPGRVVVFADALHEGPAPIVEDDEWYRRRADYHASRGHGSAQKIRADLVAADSAIDRARTEDEIVLWFEHDLFDQLLLIRLLDRLSGWPVGQPPITLVCPDRYLGPLTAEALAALFPVRQPVGPAQFQLARTAWAAFRSDDPTAIQRVLDTDTTPLPFLAGALRRHLEEFPSTREGLSRTERDILELLCRGPRSPRDLFPALQALEERIFMGDATFKWLLQELSAVDPRAIALRTERDDLASGPLPPAVRGSQLPRGVASITAFGRDLLDARADRVSFCGIDRWLGGVHLEGRGPIWRWDAASNRLANR